MLSTCIQGFRIIYEYQFIVRIDGPHACIFIHKFLEYGYNTGSYLFRIIGAQEMDKTIIPYKITLALVKKI